MARRNRFNYTPEEQEFIRNSIVRNEDMSYVPREAYAQIRQQRQERRAANRGITREELLASRGEKRKERLERREERSLNRSQMSPEAFEAFKQARLTERAAQQGITPDQLLANRAERRANSDAFAALLKEEGVRFRGRGTNRNGAQRRF